MKRVEFDFLEERLPLRPNDAHKGTMGTLLSITGSTGFAGAAVLSAKAALRSGVGLHCQVLPREIYPIFSGAVFESVCVPVEGSARGTVSAGDIPAFDMWLKKASAVLIGCGIGCCDDTREVLRHVGQSFDKTVVIDADGINVLEGHINILDGARAKLILTPHIREFSRLSGRSVEEILRSPERAAAEFSAERPGLTLALKSHRTYIARNGELYENIAGNSGMAKGGSGDVLAGITASLAAQGADPFDAAVMGVHIHALAGDLAAAKLSRTSMLPSDIIRALPEIFMKIEDSRDNG